MVKLKKKVKKKLKRLLTLVVFLLVIVGASLYYKEFNQNEASNNEKYENTKENDSSKDNYPKNYSFSLLATGDGLIHNNVALYAQTNNGYDFKPFITDIKEIVKNFDIAYYNQETPFGSPGNYTYYPTFSVPSEYGDAMLDAGFNMISLASNHSFDKGENGVLNTLNYFKNQDNIMYNGIASSYEEQNNIQIKEKNNITYALLSYTYGTNGLNVPSNKSYLVNVFDKEKAKNDILALRDKVDFLIVAMHWGVEYNQDITAEQKDQANFLADLGVDLVIGNHSHCLEPIEWIDDTLVIYSLGNFISNQIDLYSSIGYKGVIGALAMMDVKKTINADASKDININNLRIELIYTYKNTQEKYYKIIPFSKLNNDYLKNYENVYEQYKNVILKFDKTINVLPLKAT